MMTLIIIAEGIVMPMLLTATDAFHAPVHDCHCSVVFPWLLTYMVLLVLLLLQRPDLALEFRAAEHDGIP